jgi:hypothetical protein
LRPGAGIGGHDVAVTSGGRRGIAVALGAMLLCAWCGWASAFHRATTPGRVSWGLSLAAVVAVDVLFWRGRRRLRFGLWLEPAGPWPRPGGGGRPALVGVSPWVALALVVLAWDVLGLDTGAHRAHLTISALTQAFRPLDAAMLLVWMGVGIGYGAARARAPVAREDSAAPAPAAPAAPAGEDPEAQAGPVARAAGAPALLLPANRALGVGFWLAVVAVGLAIDQVARRSGGRLANSEELVRFVTRRRAANVVLVAAWGYAGYHLFAH